jgi:PXPV repeat (3 copies)
MKLKLSRPLAAAVLVALGAMGSAAQARDNVFWSLGVEAAPGVSLGVGNTRPVVVAPAPVYVAPQPVYVAPAPVIVHPRHVIVEPAPVIYEETVIVRPGHGHGRHKEHHHHH